MNKNLSTIHTIYESFGKGDIPAIIAHFADDIRLEQWADNSAQKAGVPWILPRKGKEGAAAFFSAVGQLDLKEFTVLSIMANENQVAAEVVIEARVPATGKHYRDEEMQLWTFNEEGRITRIRHYLDTAKHIAAAK